MSKKELLEINESLRETLCSIKEQIIEALDDEENFEDGLSDDSEEE